MQLELLSPVSALVGLAVLAPLAALAVVEARARRARQVLGLPEPLPRATLPLAVSLGLVAGLVALAAAQPVVAGRERLRIRTDAEVLYVVDISRSMLAASKPGGDSRLNRARRVAESLRAGTPNLRAGVASLTDRVLPYVLPTANREAFDAVLERSVAIERPPPISEGVRATSFGALAAIPSSNFFTPGTKRGVVVVLTDGEGQPEDADNLRSTLTAPDLPALGVSTRIVFVQISKPNERVYRGRLPEPGYVTDPQSRARLDQIGVAAEARVFGEDDLGKAAAAIRADAGSGPLRLGGERGRSVALAPYAAAAAFLPLGFVLWRRNRA